MRKSTEIRVRLDLQSTSLAGALLVCLVGLPAAFAQSSTVAPPGVFSNEVAWNDGTNFNFQVVCKHAYPHLRVFIDFDNNPDTGYSVNGIGADYMIEDNKVYHSLHSGPAWKWGQGVPIVQRTTPTPNTLEFSVGLASVGSPQFAQVALQGADDSGNTIDDPTVTRFELRSMSGGGGGSSGGGVNPALPVVASSDFSSEQASDDGVNFYFRAACAFPYPHFQVLIDTRNESAAGYGVNGIVPDYMIQDDKLYHYAKSAEGEPVWGIGKPVVVRSAPGPNMVEFSVPLTAIESPSTAKVIFQAIDAGGNTVSDPILTTFVRGSPGQPGGDYKSGPVDDSQEGWIFSGMTEVDDDNCKGGMEHAGGPLTYAAYTFNGSGVDIYATTGPSIEVDGRTHKLGRMKILVDGKSEGEYSLYQTSVTYQSKVYSVTGLTRGNHVLQLESGGGWIDVDFIQVSFNEQAPVPPTP